jgi:hypothetical protein
VRRRLPRQEATLAQRRDQLGTAEVIGSRPHLALSRPAHERFSDRSAPSVELATDTGGAIELAAAARDVLRATHRHVIVMELGDLLSGVDVDSSPKSRSASC